MQVQLGSKTFIKTKYTSLDGRTTVSFKAEDDTMEGQANAETFSLALKFEGREHGELQGMVASFGQLMDQTYREHATLRNAVRNKLMGNG